MKTYLAKYRQENPEKIDALRRAHYIKNRQRLIDEAKAWRLANPEKARTAAHRRLYRLEPEQFQLLMVKQGESCAICRRAFSPELQPHVDHCHQSDTVRGVLCRSCNLGLGHFKDDPDRLRAAVEYLGR